MSDAHRQPLVKKSAWSATAGITTAIGNLVTSVVVARLLGPEGTGRVAFLIWLAVTASVVTAVGVPACIQRYVAELQGRDRADEAEAMARRLVRVALSVALIVAAGGAACGTLLLPGAGLAESVAVATVFFLQLAGDVYRAWLTGTQRFQHAARISVAAVGIQVLGVTVGAATVGVSGVLVGYAAGALVPACGALALALPRTDAPPMDADLRRRIRAYALHTYIAMLVSLVLWSRVEVAFLQPTWGDHGVAMFTVGLALATMAGQPPLLMAGALLPHMAERAAAGDMDNVRRTYASATRIVGAIALPLCFGAAAVASGLVPTIYGAEFAEAAPVAALLCVAAGVGALSAPGSALLFAMERSRFIVGGGVAGALIAIVGFALVIPPLGALGAAGTRTLVQGAMVALGMWYVWRFLGHKVPAGSLVRSATAATLCAAAAAGVIRALPMESAFVVAIPAGAVVYVVAARTLRALRPDDIRMLHLAAGLLPAPVRPPFAALVRFVSGPGRSERAND